MAALTPADAAWVEPAAPADAGPPPAAAPPLSAGPSRSLWSDEEDRDDAADATAAAAPPAEPASSAAAEEPEDTAASTAAAEALAQEFSKMGTRTQTHANNGKIFSIEQADPDRELMVIDSFRQMNLPQQLSDSLEAKGYSGPYMIQQYAIPLILGYPDEALLGQAQTGSGKTCAFVLGMLSRVDPARAEPQALCLVPTRELAEQHAEVCPRGGVGVLAHPVGAWGGGRTGGERGGAGIRQGRRRRSLRAPTVNPTQPHTPPHNRRQRGSLRTARRCQGCEYRRFWATLAAGAPGVAGAAAAGAGGACGGNGSRRTSWWAPPRR